MKEKIDSLLFITIKNFLWTLLIREWKHKPQTEKKVYEKMFNIIYHYEIAK